MKAGSAAQLLNPPRTNRSRGYGAHEVCEVRRNTAVVRAGTKKPFASAAANEALERAAKHLTEHKLDLATLKYGKGKELKLEGEKFVGDAKANEMLTREYRKGFELPSV